MSDTAAPSDPSPPDRPARILLVVNRVRQLALAGSSWTVQEVCDQHADLLPELKAELLKLQTVLAGLARRQLTGTPTSDPSGQLAQAASARLAPRTKVGYFGDYEIIDLIAEGGMGVVYQARQVSLDRIVALKMIRAGGLASAAAIQRFQIEAEAAGKLDHPHIVPVYEVGEHQGIPFFSMALVRGTSLQQVIRPSQQTVRPLDGRQAARYVAKAADAIAFAHARGILHRDLKPHNVLIDENDEPHVTDFGLAKRADAETGLTVSDQILGTPSYMSPEQAHGRHQEIDCRSDVYGLGATLYALVTGHPPFLTLAQAQGDNDPVEPRRLVPRLERDLEKIILKCLQRSPAARYATAGDLRDDLQNYLAHRPVKARSIGFGGKAWRWGRRNPNLAVAVALLLVSLIAGTAISTTLAIAESAARRQSDINADKATKASNTAKAETKKARTAETKARTAETKAKDESRLAFHNYYVAQVNLAQRDWETSALDSFSDRLNETRPDKTGGHDFRGFEWHYLQSLVDPRRKSAWSSKNGQWTRTVCLACSTNGEFAAVGDTEDKKGKLRIIHRRTDRELISIPQESEVRVVCFSPDDAQIAVGNSDSTVTLWDRKTGNRIKEIGRHSNKHGATNLSFSPNGRRLASTGLHTGGLSSWDVRIWDLESGQQVLTDLQNASGVRGIRFNADGTRLIGLEGRVCVWDAESGRELLRTPHASVTLTSVDMSADGRHLAVGKMDGTIDILKADSGEPLRTLRGHTQQVPTVDFSPDGAMLVSNSLDGTVRLWHVETSNELNLIRLPTYWVRFLRNSKEVLLSGTDGTVRTWNVSADDQQRILRGDWGVASDLLYSNDSRNLFVASQDSSIYVIDVRSGKTLRKYCGHSRAVQCLHADRARNRLLSGSLDGTAKVWNTEDGSVLQTFGGHADYVQCAALNSDGQLVVTADSGHRARIWNLTTGELVRSITSKHGIMCVACSPIGRLIATGGAGGSVTLWDANSGTEVRTLSRDIREAERLQGLAFPFGHVVHASFSPDGKHLAGAHFGGGATIWNVQTGVIVRSSFVAIQHTGMGMSGGFSPSGRRIITYRYPDSRLVLWDAELVRETLQFDFRGAKACFSPDETQIAAIAEGADKIVIWDTRRKWRDVAVDKGNWVIEGDELVQTTQDKATRLVFGPEVSDYDFAFRARSESGSHGFKAVFHHLDGQNQYEFALGNYFNKATDLSSGYDGQWTRQPGMYREEKIEFGRWYDVRLEVRGSKIKCFVDGNLVFSASDPRFTKGRIGFSTWEAVARFRDIKVTSPEGDVLWDGPPVPPE